MASFVDGQTELIKGKPVSKNRGEVVHSIRWIANRWNWSIHKTCDFIELLRSQNMVAVGKENGITRLTLINYEKHNSIKSSGNEEGNGESRNGKGFGGNQGTVKGTGRGNSNGNANGNAQPTDINDVVPNQGTPEGTQTGTIREQQGDSQGTDNNKDNNPNKEKKGEDGAGAPPPPGREDKLKEKQEAMIRRRDEFYQLLVPYLEIYPKDMIRAFFNRWTEPNKSKTRMKFELEATWDLKLRLTTWENNDLKWGKAGKATVQSKNELPAGLSKIQEEVNYLYGRYLEGQITVISVDWTHFNELVRAGLIAVEQDLVEELQGRAIAYIREHNIDQKEDTTTKFAKRFGVLEFFKQLKSQAKETVFHDPGTSH